MLLKVSAVADRVGLSEWAVRRAIHDGQLPAFKIRGQLRVDALDMETWLEACRFVPQQMSAPSGQPAVTPSPAYPPGGSFRSRVRRKEAS